jgi:uncharacterized protein
VVVVADTSVLLNLCRVQLDWLLPRLFGEVWIPPAVDQEFKRLALAHSRFLGLTLPSWVRLSDTVSIPPEVSACPNIDPGETEALALALRLHADYVLLDDQAARRAAAALHQRSTGIGGILLRAKADGLIASLAPCLARLQTEGRFFISPAFHDELLRIAGELP